VTTFWINCQLSKGTRIIAMINRLVFILSLLLFVGHFYAQETITLKNPSFEDVPRAGDPSLLRPIKGWTDCGRINFPSESPPDIHPVDFWRVSKLATDGDTYLGLVVRDNDSYESVSQRLNFTLQAGKCYTFSIFLAKSNQYVSVSQKTRQRANFTKPAVLRIWGGSGICGGSELLGESETVFNSEWKRFDFVFSPVESHRYLVFEAFYKTPTLWSYNGHILVDQASEIKEMPCDEEPIFAAVEIPVAKPKAKKPKNKKKPIKDKVNRNEEKVIPTFEKQNQPTQAKISRKVEKPTKLLVLHDNKDIVIEIGGHTNGNPGISHKFCDNLSNKRAQEVALYLTKKGISPKRIEYKGYGKRKPIATNRTKKGRSLNQRVEIKILYMDS